MAEGDPPPLGSWHSLAFVQGPIVEEIGEFLGRVVPLGRGVEAIGKVLPLPWLQKLFKRVREATEEEQREDGKRVIKLHTAIQIVESWLRGLTGSAEELVDLMHEFLPAPGHEGGSNSLVDRIAAEMREKALPQAKKKYILKRPPNKQGPNKGFASDWTRRKVGDHKRHIDYQPDADYPGRLTRSAE